MSTERKLVLHHMVMKGLADVDAVATAAQLDPAVVSQEVDGLITDGFLIERTGRLSGFAPSKDGRDAHAAALRSSGLRARKDELAGWYERFEAINAEFKAACTDWQLIDGPDGPIPNDHADAAYDASIIAHIAEIHGRVGDLIAEARHPRLDRYLARLDDALAAVKGGEHRRLTAPMCESYHDVWMELHHDLLASFERQRRTTDA